MVDKFIDNRGTDGCLVCYMVFNATFNNISVKSCIYRKEMILTLIIQLIQYIFYLQIRNMFRSNWVGQTGLSWQFFVTSIGRRFFSVPDLGQMRNEAMCQLSYDAPFLGPEGGRPGRSTQAVMHTCSRNLGIVKIFKFHHISKNPL